ncbi:MAG: hypothetical protein KDB53_01290, partial [Planctomycetes bacterium]|nr:hypothetical protein [Planctomycetota bacterium]
MKTLHDPKDLRWRTLMAVLASDGEAAARVLGRHPAPPSNPTMGPERLRDLLTGELLHQEFVLASVTGQVAPKGNLDAANFFLRRRALTADRAALQLAERIPWGLARFALSDDESAQRHLIALGLALFAMRTLQITNDRRESFLRPLGTDLARAVVHRLD